MYCNKLWQLFAARTFSPFAVLEPPNCDVFHRRSPGRCILFCERSSIGPIEHPGKLHPGSPKPRQPAAAHTQTSTSCKHTNTQTVTYLHQIRTCYESKITLFSTKSYVWIYFNHLISLKTEFSFMVNKFTAQFKKIFY